MSPLVQDVLIFYACGGNGYEAIYFGHHYTVPRIAEYNICFQAKARHAS
jgi:hypothetical protein